MATATAVALKRKNIDLPVETLQKLSLLAVAHGKSLKKYIESLLISTADSVTVEVSSNPSPSGDPWFDDPENMAMVYRGIEDMKAGREREYTIGEISAILGL